MRNESAKLDSDELMHLAIHATDNNQPEQAIDYLKRLLEISADNGKAYYLLGAVHAEIGLYDRAVEEMTKAVQLEPNLPTAHFQLGLLHITSGRVDEAELAWRPLNALGEDDALFRFKRGMLHLVNDEFEACINDLSQGITLNTLNEPLNYDMQRIIDEAKQRLPSQNSATGTTPARGDGRHVLLSAYQRDDDTEH